MDSALAEFVRLARGEPASALWLSPSPRSAEETRRRLAAMGQPLLAPRVFTFESFALAILEQAGEATAPEIALRTLLEDATTQLSRDGKLNYFRGVVGMRGFIDGAEGMLRELDAANVAPDELMTAATAGSRAKLIACAELYGAICRHANRARSPVARATELVQSKMPAPFQATERVHLDGFVVFTATEWPLVESLARVVSLTVSLPDVDDEREEAFASVRATRARLTGLSDVSSSRRSSATIVDVAVRPAGLDHLETQLFRKTVARAAVADGIAVIEAAGEVGEARLVARRIRSLVAAGTRPADIVVTARDLDYSRDLLDEVFAEYGLPVEIDGERPLGRNPAVATLIRAANLADERFPFAPLTALLRSTYFAPDWPEGDAATIRRAEQLLRLLGLPRDRDAYLRAVELWSVTPPDGLEDEQAEESRRLRKARLAADCRPFLERLFRTWDNAPANAEPAAFNAWLTRLAREIGLLTQANLNAADAAAVSELLAALERRTGPAISRAAYLRLVTSVASSESQPRSCPTAGRIRIVPADEAPYLDCDYLFILGLGENSFPRTGPTVSLLDDADRVLLRERRHSLADPDARLGDEQLLFLQLVGRPRRGLVLCYPATDEKGQPLLPGSFLRGVLDCFVTEAVPVEHQRMLIEGYLSRPALSRAEARVQFAHRMSDGKERGPWRHPAIPIELCEHLHWANEVATARFRPGDYGVFDGWLEYPAALAEVRKRFGPDRVFSPTALESYVACPFRFFMEQVLALEELEEPSDEVEQTRRGAAYHRALSRLHRKLNRDPDLTRAALPDQINADLQAEIDEAVREYAERAPSPAAKKLWELEGKRLHRSAGKYRDHWDEFLDPWRQKHTYLSPQLLEADFGLPVIGPQVQSAAATEAIAPLVIEVGGVEVRIGGRIDRVDVADLRGELGFWIIDYKTGRSAYYTGTQLSRLEKLQLSLYALAVEKVFFPGRVARPLGLAYWLVTDEGPKPVMPGSKSPTAWLADAKKWAKFREQLEEWVAKIVGRIREGHFPLAPRSDHCTDTCSFGEVCRISQSRNVGKVWDLQLPGSKADQA